MAHRALPRPAAPDALGPEPGDARRLHRELERHRRSRPHRDGLPDRVEQDARAAPRPRAARRADRRRDHRPGARHRPRGHRQAPRRLRHAPLRAGAPRHRQGADRPEDADARALVLAVSARGAAMVERGRAHVRAQAPPAPAARVLRVVQYARHRQPRRRIRPRPHRQDRRLHPRAKSRGARPRTRRPDRRRPARRPACITPSAASSTRRRATSA